MCVIVYRPKGAFFPADDVLKRCWDTNKDGAGFMYADGGVLTVEKGFMTFDEFMVAYRTIPTGCPAALHFRIGTHGKNTAENTHPWVVVTKTDDERTAIIPKIAMVHNGVINGYGDAGYSDSRDFAETLTAFGGSGPFNESLQRLILGNIGYGNKIVFMREDGRVWIANEKAGIEDNGCWYSNGSFRVYVHQVQHITHPYGYDDGDFLIGWKDKVIEKAPIVNMPTLNLEKGIFKPKPKDKNVVFLVNAVRVKQDVRVTDSRGITSLLNLRKFIVNFDEYMYSEWLSKRIDAMVNTWELDLDREDCDKAALNRIE